MTRRLLPLLTAGAALALAACTTSTGGADSTATSATQLPVPAVTDTVSAEPTASSTAPGEAPTQEWFAADSQQSSAGFADAGGGDATITAIALSTAAESDQVYVEMTSPESAEWSAQWVDGAPTAQGSGEPLALDSPAILAVTIRGLGTPSATDPGVIDASDGITHVIVDPAFEGQAVVYVGTDARVDYTVQVVEGAGGGVVVDLRN